MNDELRDKIGKTLFELISEEEWDEQPVDVQEMYANMAYEVVNTFLEHVKQDFLHAPKRRKISETQWKNEMYGTWVSDEQEKGGEK